jgi:hypothetical protein
MPHPQVSHIGHLDRSKYHFIAGQKLSAEPSTAGALTDQTVELEDYATISAVAASGDGRDREFGAIYTRAFADNAECEA